MYAELRQTCTLESIFRLKFLRINSQAILRACIFAGHYFTIIVSYERSTAGSVYNAALLMPKLAEN